MCACVCMCVPRKGQKDEVAILCGFARKKDRIISEKDEPEVAFRFQRVYLVCCCLQNNAVKVCINGKCKHASLMISEI